MASNKNYMLNDKFPKHIKNATSTSDGMMSAEDKSKIDELFEFGLLSPATPDKDGIMTKEDKAKLDGVEEGANNYIHPDDENTRHVTDEQINRWDNPHISYTNSKPTPISLGGISKGEIFDNVSYDEMFTKLLYPYVEPQISDISITPNTTIMEKGYITTLDNIYFKIDAPSLSNESIHYDFKANGTVFNSLDTDNRIIDNQVSYILNNSTSITVTAIDQVNNREKTFNLIDYTFVYPFYYGSVPVSYAITNALITSKTKLIQTKGTKTLKFTTNNEKILFAYPKSYGELKAIYDVNNFNIFNTFSRSEINITGLDSNPVEYYVYMNEASTVTDYSIRFEF